MKIAEPSARQQAWLDKFHLGKMRNFTVNDGEVAEQVADIARHHEHEGWSEEEIAARALARVLHRQLEQKRQWRPTARRMLGWLGWGLLALLLGALLAGRAHGQESVTVRGATKGSTPAAPATVTATDANHNGLDVNCVAGCAGGGGGGGTSAVDGAAFTVGTTAFTAGGGIFNDTAGLCVSGTGCFFRITASRAVHINLRDASGAEIGVVGAPLRFDPTGATTQPVSGTFWQATQPVSGTFFQATQPVSCAAAATCPVNASQVGGPWTVNLTQWAGGTLGATSNYGTSPGAVLVPGVNAFVTNIPHVIVDTAPSTAVTQSGTWTVQPGNTANTTAWKVDGSAVTQPVQGGKTNNNAAPGATNVGGLNYIANASPPSYTEGNQVAGNAQLNGIPRVTVYPPNVLGCYALNSNVAYTATTSNGIIFSFRWGDATHLALVMKVQVHVVATAFTTAGLVERQLVVVRGFTASDTGGTALTPAANQNELRTSFPTSLLTDARIGGFLTAGTGTADTNPLSSVAAWMAGVGTVIGGGQPVTLYDNSGGQYPPLTFAQNEGFRIRLGATEAASTRMTFVNVVWCEAAAY